jgi:hypothetical protein
VVPARGDERGRRFVRFIVEYRYDHGDVGKVGAAAVRVVEHISIAAADSPAVALVAA